MKRMLMAIMAVAVAVTFSAPAFAETPKEGGKGKKPGQVVETIYGDEKKKEEKKGGKADDTFGEKKEEKKGK
ncbi:MAG TPA: hypothetical protein VF078_09750 [Nitrospira sp.]